MADVVKQNIIDWCKDDGIPCVDESSKNPKNNWNLSIGNPTIQLYKTKKFADRIFIQSQIQLDKNYQELINKKWDKKKRNNMLINLKTLAAQLGININFHFDDKENLIAITSHQIHFHSSISKADFLENFLRVQQIHIVLHNSLGRELGLEMQKMEDTEQAGSENPLSG